MSFASSGESRKASSAVESSEKWKSLLAELRNCLHIIEVQLPVGPLSPRLKPAFYERVQAANTLIEEMRKLGQGKGDLEKEIGRLVRLRNAVFRTERTDMDSSSEDGGEKEGFIASWESDCYEAQLHMDALEARNAEITQVSSALDQVNSLFKDVSFMVNAQGEALDRIEDYIGTAAGNCKKAGEELDRTEKRLVGNRCAQWGLVLLALLLLLLVAFSVNLYWQRRKEREVDGVIG